MAVEKITTDIISRLKPGETIWDEDLKGFGVRRQRLTAVYIFKCRLLGKQRLLTIGKHGIHCSTEKARDVARQYAAGLARAKPAPNTAHSGIQNGEGPFFSTVADRYFTSFAKLH